ncbi:MAG: AbgT family transporter [Spirochaetaceae bacterium]|nr:AbgT family transporter [Spirochaetaceae bacterium]
MNKLAKKGLGMRMLDNIERVGNKLPHPATLFAILTLAVILISTLLWALGVSVSFTQIVAGEATERTVAVMGLLSPDGIRYMVTSFVSNFVLFPPLGMVLIAMVGVTIAEGSGLIDASLRNIVLKAPKRLITVIVVFAGIMSSIAADVGYVVLIPLGAVIFAASGRHPLAGLAAAFAGVSAAFCASLLITPLDALLGGITQAAAQIMIPDYIVTPAANLFFNMVSTVFLTILATIITEKIVEPRLPKWEGGNNETIEQLTPLQKKGLRNATISIILFAVLMALTIVPSWGILRNPTTGGILISPFFTGLITIMMLFFMIPGIVYGRTVGTIKNDKDVIGLMGKSFADMSSYLVLVFFSAQFIAYFTQSNLGTLIAVGGGNFLQAMGIGGVPLIIAFLLIVTVVNLFIGSASAKWALLAPVFVPMFMVVGWSPEFVQALYRVADSSTTIITPLLSYFALILTFMQKYDPKAGIGSLTALMMPYAVLFLFFWGLLAIVWYLTGVPVGPGAPIFLLR